MGLLKTCLKLFSCKSSCKFNEGVIDYDFNRTCLEHFELKYKDMEKIHRILSKRKKKVCSFKRRDTPRPSTLANVNEMSLV